MISLPKLPVPLRVLFSSFLILIGLGYLMAVAYLFLADVKPGRDAGERMIQSIGEKYHGSSDTRLEAALRGTMSDKLTAEERDRVFEWIDADATRDGYAKVELLFKQKCATCHSAQSGLQIPPLASFEDVQKFTTTDTGISLLHLARVSHIHIFGIVIIFLLTGAIFSLSLTPIWFRVSVVVAPYLATVLDIGSWWATKYRNPVFAYIVIISGALMGLALACQIVISLWDMWIVPLRASGQGNSQKAQGKLASTQ
jgi:hypothetical protein